MKNITKEREDFIIEASANFNFTHNKDSVLSKIDPKLIEAFLVKEIAKVESEKIKSPTYQVKIFSDREIAGKFQMTTIPLVGDEITIHNRNGREQVYKVTKVRHSAYFSNEKLESSSDSSAVVWCQLIQNPVKVGLIF